MRQRILVPVLFGGSRLITLPQNLTTTAGTLQENFEAPAPTGWTMTGTAGALSADTTNYRTGSQSLKITTANGASTGARKVINWDMSNSDRFSLWVYMDGVRADFQNITVKVSNDISLANAFQGNISTTASLRVPGWNRIDLGTGGTWWTQSGTGTWASPMVRLLITVVPAAGRVAVASFDDLRWGYKCLPAILFHFSDGYASALTAAQPIMAQANIKGSIFPVTSFIGDATYLSWAQLATLRDFGWTIGNGTQNHPFMDTLTLAEQEAEFTGANADLVANGLSASYYVETPNGYSDLDANTFTALTNTGMLTALTGAANNVQRANYLPPAYFYEIDAISINSSVSLATAQGYVNTAIAAKTILMPVFHNIGAVGQWSAATFQSFVDYVRTKKNQIYAITINDLYNLTNGSVTVRKIT